MRTSLTTPIPLNSRLPLALPEPAARQQLQARSTKRMRLWGKLLTAVSLFILFLFTAFHLLIAYVLAYPPVASLASNPKDEIGLDYEDVVFPSASGRTTVSGWYIPANGGDADQLQNVSLDSGNTADALTTQLASTKTIVFSHGYGTNREEPWVPMYKLTQWAHNLNYNVLLFDYGYASKTYKAPATGGVEESEELLAAVEYAKSRGAEQVVVWGFSMGAGTALETALKTDDIDALILDSLFLTSAETLYRNITNYVSVPRYPTLSLIEAFMPIFSGTAISSYPDEDVLEKAYDIPIYIIHGTEDEKASYQTAQLIAGEQKNSLSRSWIVPGGKHELIFQVHPDEYITRAAAFLQEVNAQNLAPVLQTASAEQPEHAMT